MNIEVLEKVIKYLGQNLKNKEKILAIHPYYSDFMDCVYIAVHLDEVNYHPQYPQVYWFFDPNSGEFVGWRDAF
ncbi:MAG: hypothetical protein ACP5OE_09905 [Thermodesulfobium sp.]